MAEAATSKTKIDQLIERALKAIENALEFTDYYATNECFRIKVNTLFNQLITGDGIFSKDIKPAGLHHIHPIAAARVYKEALARAKQFLEECLRAQYTKKVNDNVSSEIPLTDFNGKPLEDSMLGPFDKRLQRLYQSDDKTVLVTPYDTRFQQVSTTGYLISQKKIEESQIEKQQDVISALSERREQLKKDEFFQGIPSLINTYAITRLYGSKGGNYLINRKGERKWYEIDQTSEGELGFSLNPTTSSIISWGNGDPYGRTPYHFSDFVFCKYWNLVPNNRMITLRRYAAPIVDNLKFPGMDGLVDMGTAASESKEDAKTKGISPGADDGIADQGTGKKVSFPPMATAITYFGEETGNSLSSILKFSAGLNWGEVQAKVFEVTAQSDPDMEAGPAGLFGGLTKFAKMLNIASGSFNQQAILNKGNLPPDPYSNGPYENRVIGPVNRIDAVKKREAGLKYDNKISIVFEYVARPIGGINTKAVLVDILSNFLVIGTASAMFWGGQHRFMANPQQYPFMGGDEGIQKWYRGDPIGWGQQSIGTFADKITDAGSEIAELAKGVFNAILGKGSLKDLITGDNLATKVIKAKAAEKSEGQIPYLTGLKALLIGEPVGEWHVTIGNPLNPIAMIGNLICDSIEVELGDELGPDDFPLEIKVTVNLDHGMIRDKDAIQSIFNRGMGRIYDLPDSMTGSGDYETKVDPVTGNKTPQGTQPSFAGGTFIADSGTTGGKYGKSAIKENSLTSGVSVWNREKFTAVSANQDLSFTGNKVLNRSAYRSADWVKVKSLK
jgi:hypothetical protein